MRFSLLLMTVVVITTKISTGKASITFPNITESDYAEVDAKYKQNELEQSSIRELARHMADLGLKVLRDLFNGNTNVIISPQNIYATLEILNLGANEKTKEEILNVLGPKGDNYTIGDVVKENPQVRYASALFLDNDFHPKPEFTDAAFTKFAASVVTIDVSHQEQCTATINSWVANHTNNTIPTLLQSPLDESTKMVVITTLLFNGKWLNSFPASQTYQGKFELGNGTFIEIPLMRTFMKVPTWKTEHFDAIGLPYQGDQTTMYLVLPKEKGVTAMKKILSHLSANSLKKFRKDSREDEVLIIVPKLKIGDRYSLHNTLQKQGLKTMFDATKANFSKISEEASSLYLSDIYQGIYFEMNEEGTVAAAASASFIKKSSLHSFQATRPFIFAITDKQDLTLFLGVVTRPSF